MTLREEEVTEVRKLVVFFDMCSSSSILENLKSADRLGQMRNLLIDMKEFLSKSSEHVGFKVYKFLGDGWILLFPAETKGTTLIEFLTNISLHFRNSMRRLVKPYLSSMVSEIGLTFGIDEGTLIRFTMMERTEYVGRALNVASRLQSAIKDKDNHPAYKCLISKPAFTGLGLPRTEWSKYKVTPVKRALRNIQGGGEFRCMKLCLPLPVPLVPED